MITVHYFAGIREITGIAEENISFAGNSIEQLQQLLTEKYPGIEESAVQFAVNEEYALPADVLIEGDVVALIPPVSGG